MQQQELTKNKPMQVPENDVSIIISNSSSKPTRSRLSSVSQNFLVKTFLGIIFVLTIQIASKDIVIKPILSLLPITESAKYTIQFSLAILVILASYKLFVRYYEKRECTELSFDRVKIDSGIGFLTGFFSITLVFAILSTLGYYSIESYNWDFPFLEVFALILASALLEELLFRGFLY